MLTHYDVKETVLRFASFEADTEAVTCFSGEWSFGRHRSRAFGKTNQAPIQCFDVRYFIFWYKLRSLGVENHITKMHNQPREPQPYENCRAKSIQEFGWTSQGLTKAGVKASRATTHRHVKEFGYSCHQRRLTWAKEKKNWTFAQWSKVLFSDESKFCISFGNQGPRVWRNGGEAHSPSCLKSSVKFPQSVMIWGAMSSADIGPLCFFEYQRHCPRLPRHFGALHTSFCWPAF